MNGLAAWIRRWWFVAAAIFALGGWVTTLQSEVDHKVDKDAIVQLQRDVTEIKLKLDDMSQRQQDWFCRDQPAWCR